MKTQLIILTLFVCSFLKGQTIPTDSLTKKFKYEQVIQTDGIKQEEIYDRSKNWIVRTLKSSDNIVNLDDANKGSIIATGNILIDDKISFLRYSNIVVNFKFSIYCKEGRYKVIVDNFILNYFVSIPDQDNQPRTTNLEDGFKNEGAVKAKKATEKAYIEIDEKIKKMISDLEAAILTNKIPSDKGNW